MTTDARPSVLLVEDDPVLGPLIAELLEGDYRIRLVTNGKCGLSVGLGEPWDVLVIDRGLPDLDGIALIAALRDKGISTPVLILTALGGTDEKVRGLDAGANDYMTKPFDAGELAARLRALTRTYTPAPQTVGIGDWELDAVARSVRSVYGPLVTLTAKECDLLAALATEPDRVFSRDDLIRAVFPPSDQPSVIDTYVHHLRRKISKNVIRTVHGVGYQIGDGHE
ncbi:response regulator transcription factor [Pseudarthrobacter sp. NBSH8]|uniref:response regulator transcription factor n=1 Tax=Pseudarthrobacter sp. NBSH8 TaxID=2596911 RepID=UPI00162AE8BF|nr:response regulator transcription factor [Pseudarthrobacter sp. NBSH8]QNE16114.1 response regulator transcription factor [Pseudarthrobacter sp. NBSH8]